MDRALLLYPLIRQDPAESKSARVTAPTQPNEAPVDRASPQRALVQKRRIALHESGTGREPITDVLSRRHSPDRNDAEMLRGT